MARPEEQRLARNAKIQAYRRNNPEKIKAERARYRERNREKIRAWGRENREMLNRRQREARQANPGPWKEKRRINRLKNVDHYRTKDRGRRYQNTAAWMVATIKRRAKVHGLEFDLDQQWIKERIDAGLCEMSGMPFGVGVRAWNLPSVDRKIAGGPYTKANCRMILWSLNPHIVLHGPTRYLCDWTDR